MNTTLSRVFDRKLGLSVVFLSGGVTLAYLYVVGKGGKGVVFKVQVAG